MNIKNERVQHLARELSTETGPSITGAIEQPLEGEIRRLRQRDELDNLGDCFAYALAKARNEPLLFKGEDLRQMDIEAAL